MQYHKFLERGLSYSTKAAVDFYKKSTIMIDWWGKATGAKKERIFKMSCEMYDRARDLSEAIYIHKANLQEMIRREGDTLVMLECTNFTCRYGPDAVGVGVCFRNYIPGSVICEKCGRPMMSREEANALTLTRTILNRHK